MSFFLLILCLVQDGSTDSLYEPAQIGLNSQDSLPRRPPSPNSAKNMGVWSGSEPCIAMVGLSARCKGIHMLFHETLNYSYVECDIEDNINKQKCCHLYKRWLICEWRVCGVQQVTLIRKLPKSRHDFLSRQGATHELMHIWCIIYDHIWIKMKTDTKYVLVSHSRSFQRLTQGRLRKIRLWKRQRESKFWIFWSVNDT